ncbi:hypothetical protein KP509_15G017100 [Ceratopteris richardii]|uniref:Uncharacterized protein n=1 Tax=Ceratopteris richardii TaxID=49495 RepID=A0A8T2T1D5_CERRI|nr:hypothetical protein KP509_15G017100 [Ceratopteris richardii]
MQTHRKPNFDALLPTKQDPLATQSATSTDPLLTKQGDETGDVFATVPNSLRALRCFSSAPAPISPSNADFKNINVGLNRYIHLAILRRTTFGFESICTQSSVFAATYAMLHPIPLSFTQRFADSPLLSGHSIQAYILCIDLHHRTGHSLQTKTQTVWIPPTSCCFLSWKEEYISRTKFKERSGNSKTEHYRPNMLQILRTNHSIKDSLSAE